MKIKNWFKTFLAGAAMGVASAIPGVSGGTIAVIVGIYKKLIDAINNLFKKFVPSFLTLLPILLGVVCAMIPCIIIFDYAFEGFVFGIVTLFAGLIIGSFPSLVKEVADERPHKKHMIILVITTIIAVGLGVLSALTGDSVNLEANFLNPEPWFYLVLIPIGVLASISLIIPGISGSMLLLVLGFYKPLISLAKDLMSNVFKGIFSNFWQPVGLLACFAVGIIVGFFTVAKFMSYLLNKHHRITFYGIIGFVIGSTLALFFNYEIVSYYQIWMNNKYVFIPMWLEIIIGLLLAAGGFVLTFLIGKYAEKKKKLETNLENEKGF